MYVHMTLLRDHEEHATAHHIKFQHFRWQRPPPPLLLLLWLPAAFSISERKKITGKNKHSTEQRYFGTASQDTCTTMKLLITVVGLGTNLKCTGIIVASGMQCSTI